MTFYKQKRMNFPIAQTHCEGTVMFIVLLRLKSYVFLFYKKNKNTTPK